MTETTNTIKSNFLDEQSESENIISADLAQVVQKAATEKQPVEAKIVEVKQIKEPEYVDPISEDYKLKKENETGSIKHRESKEGIKSIHDAFHSMGDHPDWG